MSNDVAVKENEEVFKAEHVVSLKRFPRSLQKVAKTLLASDEPMTLKEASLKAGVSYDSIRTMIFRLRKKGIDFQSFIDVEASSMLRADKIAVHKALLAGAVSGSHNHQRLYYQLSGDLKDDSRATMNVNLTVGINAMPLSNTEQREDKGVIDVEPVIPDDAK